MKMIDRDYEILREIERWRFCQGRHVNLFAHFQNQRACDRRLKLLSDAGYIERKKVIYGVAGILYLTHKGKILIGANKRPDKIRLDNVNHDIAVLDTAIFFMLKNNIALSAIKTEKQLHIADGFSVRKHQPDFVYTQNQKTYCVEIELSQKSKQRLEENIRDNYTHYDFQIWVIPSSALKVRRYVQEYAVAYPNIQIIKLEEVQNYVKNYNSTALKDTGR